MQHTSDKQILYYRAVLTPAGNFAGLDSSVYANNLKGVLDNGYMYFGRIWREMRLKRQ